MNKLWVFCAGFGCVVAASLCCSSVLGFRYRRGRAETTTPPALSDVLFGRLGSAAPFAVGEGESPLRADALLRAAVWESAMLAALNC